MNEDEKRGSDDEYEELKYLFEHHQDGSPHYDHLQGFQSESELRYAEEWAKEMNKRDPSNTICELEPNPSDPPDVFGKINGNVIGIEVTKLVPTHGHTTYTYDATQNKIIDPVQHPPDPKSTETPWSFGIFRERIESIVSNKDRKTPKGSNLHQLYLLIATHQTYLCEGTLSEYLSNLTIKQPRNFDAVFVLGDFMPGEGDSGIRRIQHDSEVSDYEVVGPNQGEGYHPLFQVSFIDV